MLNTSQTTGLNRRQEECASLTISVDRRPPTSSFTGD